MFGGRLGPPPKRMREELLRTPDGGCLLLGKSTLGMFGATPNWDSIQSTDVLPDVSYFGNFFSLQATNMFWNLDWNPTSNAQRTQRDQHL